MLYFKPIPPDHKQSPLRSHYTASLQNHRAGSVDIENITALLSFLFKAPERLSPRVAVSCGRPRSRPSHTGVVLRRMAGRLGPPTRRTLATRGVRGTQAGSQSPDTAASASPPFAPLDRGKPAAESRGHWRRRRKRPCDRQPRPPAGSRA